MARAYSMDLRERVVAAARAGEVPKPEVARRFGVSLATVYAWLGLAGGGQKGALAPKPHGGGRRRAVDEAGAAVLRGLVAEDNDRTLAEYAALFAERTAGAAPSRSALDRAFRRLTITRKKSRSGQPSRTAPRL